MSGIGFTYRGRDSDDAALLDLVHEQALKHGTLQISIEPTEGEYTDKLRGSLHLALGRLATALNDAGLDMATVLRPGYRISWTMESVKRVLYKPVLKAQYEIESTEDAGSVKPSKVYAELIKMMLQQPQLKGFVPPPWPSARTGQ